MVDDTATGALAASQSRNTASMESALDCKITIDSAGMVTEVNPAARKTFGYKRSEMVGQDLAELIIPPELREWHRGVVSWIGSRASRMHYRKTGFSYISRPFSQ